MSSLYHRYDVASSCMVRSRRDDEQHQRNGQADDKHDKPTTAAERTGQGTGCLFTRVGAIDEHFQTERQVTSDFFELLCRSDDRGQNDDGITKIFEKIASL